MEIKREVVNLITNNCQETSWLSDAMKLLVGPITSAVSAIVVFYIQSMVKNYIDKNRIKKDFKNELEYEKKSLEEELVKVKNNFYSLYEFAGRKLRGEDERFNITGFKSHAFLSLNENYFKIYAIVSDNKKQWIKIISQVYESLNDLKEEFSERIKTKWSEFKSLKDVTCDFILKEMEAQRRYMELCAIAINSINMLSSKRTVEEVSHDPYVIKEIYKKELEKINISYDDLDKKELNINVVMSVRKSNDN